MTAGRDRGPWWWSAAVAVGGRPGLWATAVRQMAALAPRRWWRARPPLPLPSGAWLAFRMETAYGDPARRPSARDVVDFLEWCRESRRCSRDMR
ncbi:MAG TPA: hypothetical protein VFN50_01560 [Acidimicrobiales bacterium]|nr:hypothetical protein [Acidimicrobiales bacterium]